MIYQETSGLVLLNISLNREQLKGRGPDFINNGTRHSSNTAHFILNQRIVNTGSVNSL